MKVIFSKSFIFGSVAGLTAFALFNWFFSMNVCYDHPPICQYQIGFPFFAYFSPTPWGGGFRLIGLLGDIFVGTLLSFVMGRVFYFISQRSAN